MKLVRLLTSREFAIVLLIISAGLLIFWNRYPDFYSPLFLVIPVFLFTSIAFCAAKRIMNRGLTRDIRFWGSMTFHAGMLVVIMATSLGPVTRFWATVILPQGMTVNMEDKTFAIIRNIPVGGAPPDIFIKMDGYETHYADNRFPVDYAAHVTVLLMENGSYRQREKDIRINSPFWWGGYQFLLESGAFSPLFVLRDKGGNVIFSQFLRVSNTTSIEDKFEIPEAGMEVYTRFFPDMYRQGSKYGSRSPYPKNPAFGIKVVNKDNPFRDIWKGVLKKGEKAEFEGMLLEFADIKQVVTLQVMNDPTYYGIFAGWLLIVGGLLMRYLPVIMPSQPAMNSLQNQFNNQQPLTKN